jgi:hypothetical protein
MRGNNASFKRRTTCEKQRPKPPFHHSENVQLLERVSSPTQTPSECQSLSEDADTKITTYTDVTIAGTTTLVAVNQSDHDRNA